MTSDELRQAAERRRSTPGRDVPIKGYGEFSVADNKQRIEDAALLADAYIAGPRWYDKPPVPGNYLVVFPHGQPTYQRCVNLPEHFVPVRGLRLFGPIPPDPEESADG